MTRRLLFDQNLAPRLVGRVAAEFPGSLHVRDLELHAATDAEVLRVAAERDLVIVTKDKDFADIVTARGGGPKILWLTHDVTLGLAAGATGFDVRGVGPR